LLPVHDVEGMLDTEAHRVASTAGLAYAPVLINEMLAGLGETTDGQINLDLIDVDSLGRPQVLFSGIPVETASDPEARTTELDLTVADRPLRLRLASNASFAAAVDLNKPFWLGLAGAGLSCSLALVVWLIATGRLRANLVASRITGELQANNQRLALALDGGNDGLWDWIDTHSQVMWWSPQFYRLLGWDSGDLEASIAVFDDLLHPDDQARTLDALYRALRDEQVYDVEFRLRHRDGSYRWFRSRAKVFRNDAGDHQRMAGSLQDIDELKAVQADVRERNQQMAAIFALSPDAFVSFDDERQVHFVSPAFAGMTAIAPDAVMGLDLEQLLARLQEQALAGPARLSVTGLQAGPLSIELNGSHTLELRLYTAPADAGISQLLHLHDITQRVEVERMKSEFLSTAAHELCTPMASIYGFTELMVSREMPPDRQKLYLAKVHRQCQAMIAILNELLDLARIEARRGKDFELEPLKLADLALEACQDFRTPEERTPPELHLADLGSATVLGDRAKLMQTLRNLLSNAYKFSPEGGPVDVTLSREDELLRLSVRDHGIGMTPDELAHVTERFYRADKSGAIPGTGLGMSIVREIIELHGGRLELTSEAGQGSCISLLLPVAGPQPPAPAETDAAPAA
jgi:PAS domain S-box-containing protein